jgi:hypothetical protein
LVPCIWAGQACGVQPTADWLPGRPPHPGSRRANPSPLPASPESISPPFLRVQALASARELQKLGARVQAGERRTPRVTPPPRAIPSGINHRCASPPSIFLSLGASASSILSNLLLPEGQQVMPSSSSSFHCVDSWRCGSIHGGVNHR